MQYEHLMPDQALCWGHLTLHVLDVSLGAGNSQHMQGWASPGLRNTGLETHVLKELRYLITFKLILVSAVVAAS